MRRNIVILILMTVSFGFLVFAFYQQTLAEIAKMEAEENFKIIVELEEQLENCMQAAQDQQEEARKAMERAHEMREKAEQNYKDALNK